MTIQKSIRNQDYTQVHNFNGIKISIVLVGSVWISPYPNAIFSVVTSYIR